MTLPVVDLDPTDAFGHLRIVPVVVIHDAQDAEPLALALKAGGLACAEVTLRTPAALESLRRIAIDDQILVGAGTVLIPTRSMPRSRPGPDSWSALGSDRPWCGAVPSSGCRSFRVSRRRPRSSSPWTLADA